MEISKVPILGLMCLLLGTAHADPRDYMAELRIYENPMVLKPYIIRDGSIVTADKSHWIPLPWKDFVAIGQDRLLFKVDGVIMTCPSEGYRCLQEDE